MKNNKSYFNDVSEEFNESFESFLGLSMQQKAEAFTEFLEQNNKYFKDSKSKGALKILGHEIPNSQIGGNFELSSFFNEKLAEIIDQLPYFLFASYFLNPPQKMQDEEFALEYPNKRKNDLWEKCGLNTSSKRVKALSEILALFITEKVGRDGRKSGLNNNGRLKFTALYNRFLIVINNAREEKDRQIRKLKIPAVEAINNIVLKYKIPEVRRGSLFSKKPETEVALNWAKDETKTNLSAKRLIAIHNEINKEWAGKGWLIVDSDFSYDAFAIFISSIDEEIKQSLSYESVYKTLRSGNESEGNGFIMQQII